MRESSTAQLAWIHRAWRKQAEGRPHTPPEEMTHPEPQMTVKITSDPIGLKRLCPIQGPGLPRASVSLPARGRGWEWGLSLSQLLPVHPLTPIQPC